MQVTTWKPREAASWVIARAVVESKGTVTAQSEAAVSASFKKHFSWGWFILGFLILYLIYYWTKRDEALTASLEEVASPQGTYTAVTFSYRGKRAGKAAKRAVKLLEA